MGTRVGANIYDVLVRVQTGAVIVRAVDIFVSSCGSLRVGAHIFGTFLTLHDMGSVVSR